MSVDGILAQMPPGFPDAETELMGLLDLLEVNTVTHLPLNFNPPIIWVQRIGGAVDRFGATDYPLMRVSYYGPQRQQAFNLSQDGSRLILGHCGRLLPSGTLLDYSDIDFGSGNEPDLDPDDRRIVVNYTLGFRRQYPLVEA